MISQLNRLLDYKLYKPSYNNLDNIFENLLDLDTLEKQILYMLDSPLSYDNINNFINDLQHNIEIMITSDPPINTIKIRSLCSEIQAIKKVKLLIHQIVEKNDKE